MPELFEYKKGYWYPHLKPRDVEIWERFIDAFPGEYTQCQYDFNVGDAPAFADLDDDEAMKKMASLYRLKIDVLGFTKDHIDLIELKHDAGASSIGQVLAYKELYMRDARPALPVFPVIISNTEKLNMQFLCKTAGVRLIVV